MFKKLIVSFIGILLAFPFVALTVFADEVKDGATPEVNAAVKDEVKSEVKPADTSVKCGFTLPDEKTYSAQLIAIRRKLRVEPGETFRVKIFMKNTGTMPWLSNINTCMGPKMSLGTKREQDRNSVFYELGLRGWEGSNRIAMDQLQVDPGEIASFTFHGKAGKSANVYKEYFAPVLKDIQWIDGAEFSFDVIVGDPKDSAIDLRKKLAYSNSSGSVSVINLNAEKKVLVDLSEQRMKVMLGDYQVKEFKISTGAAKTPTPVGETKILLKQYVRVGHKPPHYIMPRFQMFTSGGAGFHALPSLGNDGGVFWTEARNHIGIPVSHGCIRLLPEDADWLYEFTDVGDRVAVQR